MKRRELFKMLGTLTAVPFIAPLVAMCKPKPKEPDKYGLLKALMRHRDEIHAGMANGHSENPPSITVRHLSDDEGFKQGDIVQIGKDPQYFYITSVDPSPAERKSGIIEKRIYGSSV